MNDLSTTQTNFLLYTGQEGKVNVEVFVKDETIWLTQKALAELFGKERSVITKHLKNIFNESELDENMVCANFAHTTQHGAIKDKNTRACGHYVDQVSLPLGETEVRVA